MPRHQSPNCLCRSAAGVISALVLACCGGCGNADATSSPVEKQQAEHSDHQSNATAIAPRVEIDLSHRTEVEPVTPVREIVATSRNSKPLDNEAAGTHGGFDPSVRYLIIHADDAGMCGSVNRATIDSMERGVVSSASIMVPCPAFEEFARYAREHPEGDYGIHLTLNAEFESHRWEPVLPAREVPSLVDRRGYMWRQTAQTAARARADEVERELMAQIDRALKFGVPISHLDTHMGTLLSRADLLEIYVNLGIRYNLPVLFLRNERRIQGYSLPEPVRRGFHDIVTKLDEQQLPILDALYMHYSHDGLRQKQRYYHRVLQELPVGVSEIIVHCGYSDRELYNVTSSASLRDGDRRVMMDPEFAEEIKRRNIHITNWKELHELTRNQQSATN